MQIALAVALVTAAALAHVHVRIAVLQAGYELSHETRRRRELADQNQKLRLELATLRNPAHVERRARAELGMAPPESGAIRRLQIPRGPATTRVAAGPATSPRRGAP